MQFQSDILDTTIIRPQVHLFFFHCLFLCRSQKQLLLVLLMLLVLRLVFILLWMKSSLCGKKENSM